MDGLQLAREIQARPQLAGTPMMMLTSTYANADQLARLELGILRYINKPIRQADLLRVVSGILAAQAPAPSPHPLAPKPAGTLQGQVLLVEDNEINQAVAKAMLKKLGLQAHLAGDGAQAVAMVRQGRYDLVLMDCQMPVMDGYEATAAIRHLPGGHGATLPIIALTANAMQGDEQKCRDAGMDGFLAKPYTLDLLRAALAPWLGAAGSGRAAAAGAPGASVAGVGEVPAIDPGLIDALRQLDETGSMDLAREVLQAYLATADLACARAEAAIADGDAKVLGQTAHALKSSSANVGAAALSACWQALEACGREGRIDAARALLGNTQREHRRALASLRELLLEPAP
jgi:CheY-like chemotaxis protein/HPt (histidine-containing phosphotransfer) domain-containing protein